MKARVAISALATLVVVALVAACSEEEIVLARLPPTKDAGLPMDPKRCVEDVDCTDGAFCARTECWQIAGTCARRPVVCDERPAPVCGCDGITYWSDCLRRAAGITSMTPGECEPGAAKTCRGHHSGERCPVGTSCARLLPPALPNEPAGCPPEVPGTCWALPAVCPPEADPNRWTGCGGPDLRCRTTCDAIRTGEPHRRATACP